MHDEIIQSLLESAEIKKAVAESKVDEIERISDTIITTYRAGGKVVLFGNGGSAADAQHIAAELMGRFNLERQPLAAIALNTNTSTLTAISNDYGYEASFSRQVEALVNEKDTVIGISTSGNSPNVVEAIKAAKRKGAKTIGLTGGDGGKLATAADIVLTVPSSSIPRIQEVHITIGHIICMLVEKAMIIRLNMAKAEAREGDDE